MAHSRISWPSSKAKMGISMGRLRAAAPTEAGNVFEMTRAGKLRTLHSFDYVDGYSPDAGLVLGTDGNFYGTTMRGGTYGLGSVY